MTDETELKSSRMLEKSQNKKIFFRSNYKLREFVLTPTYFKYYDASGNNRGKLKGKLELSSLKYIEKVLNDDLDKKSNVFQIGYFSGGNCCDLLILFVVAGTEEEREDWIRLLRYYAREQSAVFQPRFHSGIWLRPGKYSCCGDICRWSMGCELVSNEERVNSVRRRGSGCSGAQWEPEWVVALYDFNPGQLGQMTLVRGERYCLVDCNHPDWWFVRSPTGDTGYVPSSHVGRTDGLWSRDWFHGEISRQQAESRLFEENREGCFLVRCSSGGPIGGTIAGVTNQSGFGGTSLTLSVLTTQSGVPRVHHYRIRQFSPTGPFYISDKHVWPTVPELIEYHRHNAGGLVVRLRSALANRRDGQFVPLAVDLHEFEIDPNDLRLDKTPIGHGQFGVVKKGEFRNMQVAVKQMVEGTMNEEDFIDEARNMRFLNHPNLVRLFGVVLKSRPIMIITEYMKHGSLRDFLRANFNDYWNKTGILSDVCAQVAKGMEYLEQRNFVHRDLAARNCLVKSVDRRSLQVKVADFGMARFLLDNVYESSAGTKFPVRWAAPEVFQAVYTTRADVWSFGILMWEVFSTCMQSPYSGQSNSQIYQFIVGGGRLSKPSNCPDRLYVLMLECWQHEPTKRPGFQYISSKITDFIEQNYDN